MVAGQARICAQTPAPRWLPIISVHLFYGGPRPSFDRACAVSEPFQWVFNKSADFDMPFTYVQAVASAAEGTVDLAREELIRVGARAALAVAPELAGRLLERAFVCRERRATFSTAGNSDALRPGPARLRNAFLAGDWTDTGWPATIESAVRSGRAAAKRILGK